MRYVYFLLLFVFVTSCAQGRLRLKKVDKEDRIEVASLENKKKRSVQSDEPDQEVITPSSMEEESEFFAEFTEASNEVNSIGTLDSPENEGVESLDETTEDIEEGPTKRQKLRIALIAERDARKAKNAFIWSLAMLGSFFIPILGIAALFSLIPFIIGSIKLNQSNKSDYITPEGEYNARSARVMQLVYSGLVILMILFILLLIFVIF
ncbi:MAG: hypothetical protein DCO96_03355 [Fluviicola sp. XM-24bin1]|nr:MAG: hypothetical protein DCO96_03355 [Fluviicola sp. XM-24bin1]